MNKLNEKKEQLLNNYLYEETEKIRDLVRDSNCYNGVFDYLDYQDNDDEFFNIYYSNNVIEAVRAVSYGEYSYYDDFVKLNDLGNLESIDKFKLANLLNNELKYIIDEILQSDYLVSHLINHNNDNTIVDILKSESMDELEEIEEYENL